MMINTLRVLIIGLVIPLAVFAEEFTPDRTLVYKTIDEVGLVFDVFEPPGHQSASRAPAIVFFFGGGWVGGETRQFYEQARFLAERGMVAISAEYRVKSRHGASPFDCVSDAKSAIRWTRQHAAELGVDPDRIVAAGGSAGGHLAACTGLIKGMEESGEDLSISSVPNALVLFNPVLDTTANGYGLEKVGEARQTDVSPCHHVRPGVPPTLLMHGMADTTVPFENAERFTRLMVDAGNHCQLEAFEGQEHGFFNGSFFRPALDDTSNFERTMELTVEFLSSLRLLDPTPPH